MTNPPLFPGLVLGIETSCDETSAAIVEGRHVRSNIISSQAGLHEKWGGVVPEAAARAHVEAILPVIEEALDAANARLDEIAAIAVTNRPGLVGALSVGLTAGKALAYARGVPLVGVHHLEGHLLSILAVVDGFRADVEFPHLALIVSGGHTEIILVDEGLQYTVIGQTIDDAAGEAFDKSARLLGLGYPGGRAIEVAARGGDSARYPLPRALLDDPYNFSFSGLKTAVLRLVEREGERLDVADAAASVQEAITGILAAKSLAAAEITECRTVTLVGGVAANAALRARLEDGCYRRGLQFVCPPVALCTDNAAMIALAGSCRLALGQRDTWELDASSLADLAHP